MLWPPSETANSYSYAAGASCGWRMEKKMSDNDNYHILIGVSESTVNNLISNLEKTIEILKNGGHVNLAHRLRIDKENLEYWREKDEPPCKSAQDVL
jgi:hypothetical protein